MFDFASLSPEELADRRRDLRRQRRIRSLQTVWRSLAVSGLTAGAVWFMAQPFWFLQDARQVVVVGNTFLSADTVRDMLPLTYPQPLLSVQPEAIAQQLQAQPPIAQATVTRHLLPPRLEITIQEHQPIAITIPAIGGRGYPQPGLLDAAGNWMPQASIQAIDADFPMPDLIVRGFDSQYQEQWSTLYPVLQASNIGVTEIDWRSPANLILHTPLGVVHLGAYDPYLIEAQLATLGHLYPLTNSEQAVAIEYIDLSNPHTPTVKVNAPNAPENETNVSPTNR